MASAKDIAQLGAEIMRHTPLAPFAPLASGLAKILPGGGNDEEKQLREIEWKIENIPRWKRMAAQLMDIPMTKERKGEALKGRMWSDWFTAFGQPPEDEWIEELHENVYRSVVSDMATEGLG